jgi:hypothetical protein
MFRIILIGLMFVTPAFPSFVVRAQGDRGGLNNRDKVTPRPTPVPPVIPNTPQAPTTNGVRVFGDWPATGRCDFTLLPQDGYQGLPNPNCNDSTSAVDVPFGMSLEICEHDGKGSKGLGKCRRFLPGLSTVGEDLNDKATSYKVEKKMIGYLNSKDFDTGIQIGVTANGTIDGPKVKADLGADSREIVEDYSIELPPSCPHPTVIEGTKAGDAHWGYSIANNRLTLWLRVKSRGFMGANNWVGVEILCN